MLTPAGHVRWARCGPEAIAVLDLRTGTWRMFEGIGARIWTALALHGSADGVADEIAIPAAADPGATRDAVDSYIRRLRDAGLLAEAGPRARGYRMGRSGWRR